MTTPPSWWTETADRLSRRTFIIARGNDVWSRGEPEPNPSIWRVVAIPAANTLELVNLQGERLVLPLETFWENWRPLA